MDYAKPAGTKSKGSSMKKKKPATRKKQGYNAKLDESLGMRKGKASSKKQSMKSRRDESKGMAKKVGKKKGKQFSKQPKSIAKKTKRYRT